MKKIITIFSFIFLLSGVQLNAQTDFKFGFQASPSFSWMNSSNNKINASGTNLGVKFGLVAEYYFAPNYGITSGIGFAFNQGGTLLHDIGGDFWAKSELSVPALHDLPDGVKLKYNLQYLEIPFGFKMKTEEFGHIKYFMEVPIITMGILTQAKGNIEGTDVSAEKEDIKKDVTFLNFSWGLGGGAEYTINTNTSLVAGLYFQSAFIDMTGDSGKKSDGTPEKSKGTAKSITLRIGVIF